MLTRSASTAITLAGIDSATLTGDSGDNVIAGNLFTGTLTLGATLGTDSLTGNGANTTLRTPTAGTTVNVTALNSGDAMGGTTTFSGVGNLRGNSGADTFAFAGAGSLLSGNVTGVGGNDTLDLRPASAPSPSVNPARRRAAASAERSAASPTSSATARARHSSAAI